MKVKQKNLTSQMSENLVFLLGIDHIDTKDVHALIHTLAEPRAIHHEGRKSYSFVQFHTAGDARAFVDKIQAEGLYGIHLSVGTVLHPVDYTPGAEQETYKRVAPEGDQMNASDMPLRPVQAERDAPPDNQLFRRRSSLFSNDSDIPLRNEKAPATKLEIYQKDYATMGNAPYLSMPFLVGMLLVLIIAVSATTYGLQKNTCDSTVDLVTRSWTEQFFVAQRTAVQQFFKSGEEKMQLAQMVIASNTTQYLCNITDPVEYKLCTFRPILEQLAMSAKINNDHALTIVPYFAEIVIVRRDVMDREGEFRGLTYGFTSDKAGEGRVEWEGHQPGILRNYNVNFSILPSLPRTSIIEEYPFLELEPVAQLAQEIEGIGFDPPYVLEGNSVGESAVFSGVFLSWWRDARLDFYVHIQFSIKYIDQFLESLKGDFPFALALLDLSSGALIGDSTPDKPFVLTDGFHGFVNDNETGEMKYVDSRKVLRRFYSNSTSPLVRLGGQYVYENIGRLSNTETTYHHTIVTLGKEPCYIIYGILPLRNLKWLMYVVIPLKGVRGEIDDLNVRFTTTISIVFSTVCICCFALLLWVSRLFWKLSTDMQLVANMDFDELDDTGSRIPITELKKIQLSFLIMVERLNAFSKYVPLQVVKTLSKEGQLAVLKMSPSFITISFTDIQGFTTMCTRVHTATLARIVNLYFEIMTNIVQAYRGTVDKYIGDCVMVLWGAPKAIVCPNLRACCAALAMDHATTRLKVLRAAFNRLLDGERLTIRTGIHAGKVLAGNMGMSTRMNYTVIGDSVNTAARLEAVNKDFGTRILVSQEVARAQDIGMNELVLRQITNVRVMGREKPLCVFEVMGIVPGKQNAVGNGHCRPGEVAARNGETPPQSQAKVLSAGWERRMSQFAPPAMMDGSEGEGVLPDTPTSKALRFVEDIDDSDILANARALSHAVSEEDVRKAKEFSDAVERYVNRDFDDALPPLQAAFAKAASDHDKDLLREMIKDCQGPRDGFLQGKHK